MAIAEHIGYDATGRKDQLNDLDKISDQYQEFKKSSKIKPIPQIELFHVLVNQIEERLDPYYYKPEFRELELTLSKKYKIKRLSEIGYVFDGPFGSDLKNEEYVSEGVPLIRVQNIKRGKLVLDKENTVFISEQKHNELKRSEVRPGDVVITKTGWLGNAAVVPEEVKKANIRADLAGV